MNYVSNPEVRLRGIDIDEESPSDIRREVAEIARAAVDADAGVFCRYSLNEEGDYFTSIEAVGDPSFIEQFDRYCDENSDCCPIWDPRYPPKEADQKFDIVELDPTTLEESSLPGRAAELYQSLEVSAEASALLYDGAYFLGWLAVFRLGDGGFDEAAIERLDALVEPASEQLIEAARLEVELLDDKPARILVNPALRVVECASGNAFRWLDDERKQELLDRLDTLDSKDSYPVKLTIDGYAVWVTQMTGDLGMRLLATVEHSPMPEKEPDAVLTPRQREVVGYAAAGATNREIAETLDITPDTVSDHLSEAYERLGVANRVELALKLSRSD